MPVAEWEEFVGLRLGYRRGSRCVSGCLCVGWDVGVFGGPTGKESQGFGGWAVWFGGVGDDHEAVTDEFHRLAGEMEVAAERAVEPLGSGAVVLDVVSCPAGAELLSPGREFTNEVGEALVVRVAPASARSAATRHHIAKRLVIAGS
jgi:hypothetical protein